MGEKFIICGGNRDKIFQIPIDGITKGGPGSGRKPEGGLKGVAQRIEERHKKMDTIDSERIRLGLQPYFNYGQRVNREIYKEPDKYHKPYDPDDPDHERL
jgi:hypothetical protein